MGSSRTSLPRFERGSPLRGESFMVEVIDLVIESLVVPELFLCIIRKVD